MAHPFAKLSTEEIKIRERKLVGAVGLCAVIVMVFAVFQIKTSLSRVRNVSSPESGINAVGKSEIQELMSNLEETATRADAARNAIATEISNKVVEGKAQDAVADVIKKEILNQGIKESGN